MNDNNEQNNNASLLGTVGLGAGLAGGAGLGASALKDKATLTFNKFERDSLKHANLETYSTNKFMDLKSKMKAEQDAKKKLALAQEMRKYRRAMKAENPYIDKGYFSFHRSSAGGNKNTDKILKRWHDNEHAQVQKEFESEKSKALKDLNDLIENKEKRIPKKAFGALASVIGGVAIPKLVSAIQNHNSKQLNKTSGWFGQDDNLSDKEEKGIETYTAQNKSSFLPAMAASMFAGGVVSNKIGDRLLSSNKANETKVKYHLSNNQKALQKIEDHNKELDNIEKKIKAAKGEVEAKALEQKKVSIEGEISKLEREALTESRKAATFGFSTARSSGNYLKSISPTLKWGALPLGLIGGYQMISKKTNKDNPGLVKDPDTAKKLHLMGNAAMIGGLGLIGKSMWRPLIKPMLEQSKKMQEVRELEKGDAKEEIKKMRDEFRKKHNLDQFNDEDILNKRKRDLLKDEVRNKKEEGVDAAKNTSVDTDAKTNAIGSALLTAGTVGSYMYPDRNVLEQEKKDYLGLKNKQLEKKSFVGEAAIAGAAHVGQNIFVKSRLHGGGVQKTMARSLKEGNKGVVSKSKAAAIKDGLYSGTLDPDSMVIRGEMREMGKKLREKGVNFERLSPEDKMFLNALSEGDLKKVKTVLPYSQLGHSMFFGKGQDQIVSMEELVDSFAKLNKTQFERQGKKLDKSMLKNLARALTGKDHEGYLPARDSGAVSKAMNAVQNKVRGTKFEKFINKDFDDRVDGLRKKIPNAVKKHTPNKLKEFFRKKDMSLEEADKIERAAHAAGASAVATVEPAISLWNAAKPTVMAHNPVSNTLVPMTYGRNGALGAIHGFKNKTFNHNMKLSDELMHNKGDLFADYALSPSLGSTNRLLYDTSKLGASVFKDAKGSRAAENKLKRAEEIYKNPYQSYDNAKADHLKRQVDAANFDKNVRKYKGGVSDETKEKLTNAVNNLKENQVLDKDIVDDFKPEIREGKNELASRASRAAATADLDETKKMNEFNSKVDNFTKSLGLPGALALGGAFASPAMVADYKNYKNKRAKALAKHNQLLRKHSSDDSQNNNTSAGTVIASGIAGGLAGGAAGHAKNYEKTQSAQSIIARLSLIANSNPDEAKKILEDLKKEPNWKYVKNLPSIQKLEAGVNDYVKRVDDTIKNAPERKKVVEIQNAIDSLKKQIGDKDVNLFAETIRRVSKVNKKLKGEYQPSNIDDVLEAIRNGKMKDSDEAISTLSAAVADAKKNIRKRVGKIGREFSDDIRNGELSKHHTNAYMEAAEHLKPSKRTIIGKGLLGSAVGAGLGLVADKMYDKTVKIHKDNDPRNKKNYSIAPWLAGGTILGALAGHGAYKGINRLKQDVFNKTLDNKFITPSNKLMQAQGQALMSDMPNAMEKIIEEQAKPGAWEKRFRNVDMDKIKKAGHSDVGIEHGRSFSYLAQGAAGGTAAGFMLGNMHNEDKKNQISREQLLKKHSMVNLNANNNQNDNYKKSDALLYGGTVAATTGLGTVIGKGVGDNKKLKLTPAFELAKKDIQSKYNPVMKDGKTVLEKDYRHFKNIHSAKDLDTTLEMLKNFKSGKKIIKNINPVYSERNNQRDELKKYLDKYYKADEAYRSRKEELAKKEELLRARSELTKGSPEYNKLSQQIDELVSPSDNAKYSEIESKLNNLTKAEGDLINSDLVNKVNKNDFKMYSKIQPQFKDVENEFKHIPRTHMIRGGAAGLGVGLVGALMMHHNLNSAVNQQSN